jgi:cation diffusion facilitator CzcD-associated flavoprotein CzcO
MSSQTRSSQTRSSQTQIDAVIVGAGFAGLYSLYRLRQAGYTARVFETGDNVGGTWYWNRYPGARCDIESMEYSYSFDDDLQQKWDWSERYATQPELLEYANHVADRHQLRDHITFNTRVASAHYNEDTSDWMVTTDGGETVQARFCIMATGCLSSVNQPKFEGIDTFKGNSYHTGQWPHEGVDFTGETVGIIGTGSSAIQSIPLIAEQSKHLTIFQRTANFSVPAHNQDLDPKYVEEIKNDYNNFRQENRDTHIGFGARRPVYEDSVWDADEATRQSRFEQRWALGGLGFTGAFADLGSSKEANNFAAEFIRGKIRNIVDDADVAELLCPDGIVGCKRMCVDTGYYATFNRDNVSLVDVSEHPVEKITPNGLITNGQEYTFDNLIFATGFDAMTGSLLRIDIRGKDGLTLQKKWEAGPKTYLGLSTSGFPNLFTISGPGSPSVLSNMILTIEQHVNWIMDCIDYMRDKDLKAIEANSDAEEQWVHQGNEIANTTMMPTCNSWYLGANVPGKPRVFMPFVGGLPFYFETCDTVAKKDYLGFSLT